MYTLLISFFILAIFFSFMCSLWEAVLLSITPTYARIESNKGTTTGRHLQEFKENIDRPLSAILTLNTIAHTVGAIGVGEQAAAIWAESNPLITRLLVPSVMTLAVLILSEIVPKTIGAHHWQKLAKFTVFSLRFLMIALAPLVWLGQLLTRSLKHDSNSPVLTRSDFLAMTEMGEQDGVFDADETQMIGSMIRFQSVQVKDIMTPRTVVSAASQEQTINHYYKNRKHSQFSRIPTFSETGKDSITGYILKIDVAEAIINGQGDDKLTELRRDIVAVSETLPVTELFTNLMSGREHIALALDEFGGVAGIVTMEDLIETILGMEIMDETDTATDMRVLAQKHREKRAQALSILEPKSGI